MPTKKTPAGLDLRLAAARRLRLVLAGAPFSPLGPQDLPESRDRALANRLITTALRRQGQIDVMLGELLEKGLPPRSGLFEAVMRLSLAQLVFLPEIGAHSALYLAVEAVKRDGKARHLHGLMNAVLRRAQTHSARFGLLDEKLLFPEPFRGGWTRAYGEAAMARFADALIAGAPLDLTFKQPDRALCAALGAEPLPLASARIAQRDRPVEALPFYREGQWWVQDAAAALPARLLAAPPDSTVLDMCAAPGGKTAQLIAAGYKVTALDRDPDRLERLRANMARLGYAPRIVAAEAASYAPDRPFAGIVLDAPCSATGTFRRHPEVLWHRASADIAERAHRQQALLANALRCLMPGGSLIYCVCSLEPEEGEAQLDWALTALPPLQLHPIEPHELPGWEAAVNPRGFVRTHPALSPGGVTGGADGFFIARFRRRA